MRTFIRNFVEDIAARVDDPRADGDAFRRSVARAIRFSNFGVQQLIDDRAPQMAAALAYRTIFSLIPVLVVSLVMLGSFYGPESYEEPLHRMLDFAGLSELKLSVDNPDDGTSAGIDPVSGEETPAAHLEGESEPESQATTVADWISDLVVRVQSLNFAAIGAVGVIILIYAAFSLLFEIERAFNIVYVAERGRPTIARLTKYWALLTLGPLLLLASFYASQRLTTAGAAFGFGGVRAIATFVLSWLLLTMVYTLGPNARVAKRPALIGAFVAAILWEAAKWGFAKYLTLATGYTAFYGSLGLLPVFLLWIYLTWLIILFGLELSYVAQMFPGLDGAGPMRRQREGAVAEPALAVVILKHIATDFEKGSLTREADLLERTDASPGVIQRFCKALIDAGLARAAADSDGDAITLARPASAISLDAALQAGLAITSGARGENTDALLTKIHDAQHKAMGDLTLDDLASHSAEEDPEK